MDQSDVGFLLNEQEIKSYRRFFKEAVEATGLHVIYRAPLENWTSWDGNGELDAYYSDPITVPCNFAEFPDQKTTKRMGWVAELQENSSLIQVPYDTPDLQVGSLFNIPSGLDGAKGRWFRVISIQNAVIFPAYFVCEIAPVLENTMDKGLVRNTSGSGSVLVDGKPQKYTRLGKDSQIKKDEYNDL